MVEAGAGTGSGRKAKAPGSVRQRFLLLTFAIALPALIGAAVLVRDAYRFTRTQTERQLLETTRALSLVVDRQLGQSEAMLRALASSPELARGDLRAFDRHARAAISPASGWAVLYDLKGRQLVNTRLPAGAVLPAPRPGSLRDAAPTIRRGGVYYCNLTEGPAAREPVLCVAIPVRDAKGSIAYALTAVFEPAVLDILLAQQRLPKSWYGAIVDRGGRVLARSVESNRYRGYQSPPSFLSRIKESSENVRETVTLDGVPVLSALSRSPTSGWTFVVAMPRSELAVAVQRSLALGVAVALALLALGIGMALLAARSLSRPIVQLADDARRLGRGEAVARRTTGVHELDEVSETLANAAAELSTVQLRLNLAKQTGRIGVWERNGDDQQSWWSNSFYEVAGLDPSLPPDNGLFASLIFDEDRQAASDAITEAREGDSFDFSFRFRRPDGETRWLTTRGRCVRDNPRRVIGICLDVTEMRRLSDQLEAANAQLESRVAERTAERDRIWKLSRELFVVIGLDAAIVAVNPAWTVLLGWTESDLVGRSLRDFIHPEDIATSGSRFAELAAGHVIERVEIRLRHRDGRWRAISWTAVPEGEYAHAVGRDVTDERSAAAELAAAQAALHEAQKLETLGQLTGGVAHDFNNLLTPIVGTLDLLRRRLSEDKRAGQLLDAAITSADRARTLVDRLLTFARRQTLKPRSVDLATLIEGMVDLIRRSLGPTVPIVVDIPAGLPPAQVDPNQLELALLNLALNARDAMADGGTLTISADEGRAPADLPQGRYLRLSVTDEGEGMDAETLRRAVEPFFSTKGIGKGTGLGLSMAHGLAAQSGGALTLDSRPGAGTTATLWLPVAAQAPDKPEAALPEPLARHCGTILLVDDEPGVRATTAAMLDDLGCTIIEANSGAEALAILRKGVAVDLLVTDQLMPGMVGSALIAEARTLRPGLPAMVVSGFAEAAAELPDDVRRLAKPFRSPELSAHLDVLLRQSPAARQETQT